MTIRGGEERFPNRHGLVPMLSQVLASLGLGDFLDSKHRESRHLILLASPVDSERERYRWLLILAARVIHVATSKTWPDPSSVIHEQSGRFKNRVTFFEKQAETFMAVVRRLERYHLARFHLRAGTASTARRRAVSSACV